MWRWFFVVAACGTGCASSPRASKPGDTGRESGSTTESDCPLSEDVDFDGFCDDDCAPEDPEIHPDAWERCNDIDDDCDGAVDEEAGSVWYRDDDGDGYGAEAITSCIQPEGTFADNGADCDDSDPLVFPGADEAENGYDDDCDGRVDEGEDPDLVVSLAWSTTGLTIDVTGAFGLVEFGMAETGVGDVGWFGESCITGEEPYGYPDYGYDICHTLSSSGGHLDSTSTLDAVDDGVTLFHDFHADDITWILIEPGTGRCVVGGNDTTYYADFFCSRG